MDRLSAAVGWTSLDEPNVELKCQSVHQDMMFLASNFGSDKKKLQVFVFVFQVEEMEKMGQIQNFGKMKSDFVSLSVEFARLQPGFGL